jgi:hypothetical protein
MPKRILREDFEEHLASVVQAKYHCDPETALLAARGLFRILDPTVPFSARFKEPLLADMNELSRELLRLNGENEHPHNGHGPER